MELITGRAETDHISANDYRAINRSNYGQGRYIFKDAENMALFINAASGIITISPGSCMWSGMHIRNSVNYQVNYLTPTTSQKVYLCLTYSKSEEGFEVVTPIAYVGEPHPIIKDNLSDYDVLAGTIFAEFIHNPSTNQAENLVYHFKTIDCHEDFDLSTIESKIDKAVSSSVEAKTSEYDKKFALYDDKISGINVRDILYNGNGIIESEIKITLNKNYRDYSYLTFAFSGYISGFGSGDDLSFVTIPMFAFRYSGVSHFFDKIYFGAGEVSIEIYGFYDVLEYSVKVKANKKIRIMSIYGVK